MMEVLRYAGVLLDYITDVKSEIYSAISLIISFFSEFNIDFINLVTLDLI